MLLFCSQVVAAGFSLRVHHFLGVESLPHKELIEPWARRVEAESNGRIEVKVYPEMALGGEAPQLLDQALNGTVDILWTAAAYTPKRFPHTEVFTLPLVHAGDPVATNQALMSEMDGILQKDFHGFKPLLAHVQVGHSLHLSRKTVNAASDLSGLVLRPAGRTVGVWVVEALGANRSRKRHPKLSDALANNRLDGALMSFQLAQALDVIESVQSHTMLAENRYFGTSLYLFLMGQASYDALPVDLRRVIDRNSGMTLAEQAGHLWRNAERKAIAVAREQGNVIKLLNETQQHLAEEALKTVLVRWSDTVRSQGVDGPALIDKARQAIARYRQ